MNDVKRWLLEEAERRHLTIHEDTRGWWAGNHFIGKTTLAALYYLEEGVMLVEKKARRPEADEALKRAVIELYLSVPRLTQGKIAERLNVGQYTVSRIIKKWEENYERTTETHQSNP